MALSLRKDWSTKDPDQLQEELQDFQRSVFDELVRLGARARVRAASQADVFANYGDLVRLDPPSAGLVLTLPPATPAVANAAVEAVITSADGSVTVQVVDGLVDGEEEIVLSPRIGRARFTCDGEQWFHAAVNSLGAVSLSALEAIAPGRTLGLQIDASGPGAVVPLTGAEQTENLRYTGIQTDTAGGQITLADDTTILLIDASVTVTGITGNNLAGREIRIRVGAAFTVTFQHLSGVSTEIGCPANVNFVAPGRSGFLLREELGVWRITSLPGTLTILAAAYPVGSIYFSTNSTNPATSLGFGTWSAFGAGRVPVGFDSGQTEFDTDEETGGAKTVAAAGTNSVPTFTGAAMGTHAHELPFTKTAGGTGALRMLAQSVFGSGTSRASESVSAAPTASATANAVALSQAVSAGTPSGTVSAPNFTGSATSVLQPYIVVRMWKRTA